MSTHQLIVIEPKRDYQPTDAMREEVAKMVACGLDEFDIAFFLKIEPLDARRIFADELKYGTQYFVGRVGAAMIDAGLRGDVNAQRSFLQMRGRWTVPTKQEADDDSARNNLDEKKRLMTSIIDMMTGKVTEGPAKQAKK